MEENTCDVQKSKVYVCSKWYFGALLIWHGRNGM